MQEQWMILCELWPNPCNSGTCSFASVSQNYWAVIKAHKPGDMHQCKFPAIRYITHTLGKNESLLLIPYMKCVCIRFWCNINIIPRYIHPSCLWYDCYNDCTIIISSSNVLRFLSSVTRSSWSFSSWFNCNCEQWVQNYVELACSASSIEG